MKNLNDLSGRVQARMRGFCRAVASEKVNLQLRGRRRSFHRGGDGGQALTEIAIMLPIVMMVMTGIFSVGFSYFNQQTLSEGVTAGAQYLSVSRTTTTDPCADVFTKLTAAAPNLKTSNITLTTTMNGTAVTGTTCSGQQTNLVLASTSTVKATYPCNIGVFGVNFVHSCLVSAQVSEYVY